MKHFKLLLAPFLFALSVHAQVERVNWNAKDYWNETKLSFEELIYDKLNNISCYSSEALFIGCVEAVNQGFALTKNLNKQIVLATPSTKLDFTDFYGFKLQILNSDIIDLEAQIENYIKELKEIYKTYSQFPNVLYRTDFQKTFKNIDEKLPKENYSYSVAVIYNTFLSTAFDPHTYIIPTNLKLENEKSNKINTGKYGFTYKKVTYNQKERFIITQLENGPMKKAGANLGDVFLIVNGKSTISEIDSEFNKQSVDLKLIGSSGVKYLKVERGEVEVEKIKAEIIESHNNTKVGYIYLSSFSVQNACDVIYEKSIDLIESGAEGFILDLRNNGGGYVHVAKCIMSLFLEDNSVIWGTKNLLANKTNEYNFEKLIRSPKLFKPNILSESHNVVLINGYSASASEATAIYLQAYRKAFIVGERSYGKGTMQVNTKLASNTLVTQAQTSAIYLGPHGVSPQIQGVIPEFVVYPNYGQTEATKFNREADRYKNVINYEVIEAPVMNERKLQISKINNCLNSEKLVEATYQLMDKFQKLIFDQQLFAGASIIQCALSEEIQVFSDIKIPSVKSK
jgi:C-terminal peptidase prc